jgi:hypothetical protein
MDVNWFRQQLKALEASEDGMAHPDTHRHFPEVTISGLTLARVVEIINDFKVEFEDKQYTVQLYGANHNIADVKVPNQVSIVVTNSAGLTEPRKLEDIEKLVKLIPGLF